ncbi:hypothetical protein [Paracidovorax valerianellae]|uniref:hypothetical protein n=1 Tax=Paracidovorax valerianellae TaxID=187868 RepID=UPI0023030D0D|nr:hypothetical protein [Paracidovorax valerianellae]MDA8445298.1 hypothetical protein [Paracidovorax valerianellae]
MADPTTITCASACTVTVVHEFSLPLLNLGLEEAAAISSAILLVWTTGWAFRTLILMVKTTDGNQPTED